MARLTPESIADEGQKHGDTGCSFCGSRSSAFWQGNSCIYCCTRCAVNILPALIADALVERKDTLFTLRDKFSKVEGRFWEASFHAKDLATRKPDPESGNSTPEES